MDNRKYQIFVSSTYTDLQEERTALLFAILKLNYIPAGMEFFTAIDEEQMEYIRRVIDESDYYVLVLGARYGSSDSQGISYTEREYEYAVSQGKKIIALIHRNPDNIKRGKTDKDEALFEKFMTFREKVMKSDRMVSLWESKTELIEGFLSSLFQTIQRFPATGWMRGDVPANAETLQKIATLELENQRLRESVKSASGMQIASDVTMKAYSITNPDGISDTEIECVSLDINCQWNDALVNSLLVQYRQCFTRESMSYYLNGIFPWFVQMAKICRFDLRIINPYPFSIRDIRGEHHLFNEKGDEVRIPDTNYILKPAPCPHPGFNTSLTKPTKRDSDLHPRQSSIYDHNCYYAPSRNRDFIYQRIFYAENILEPINKEIKVHFRIKRIDYDFKDLLLYFYSLDCRNKFDDAGVIDFVEVILDKEREEQDSCDTQK